MSNFDDYQEEREFDWLNFLRIISTWFIKIGLLVATIVMICLLATGQFSNALLYFVCLIFSFCFGYFFMFCLDQFITIE